MNSGETLIKIERGAARRQGAAQELTQLRQQWEFANSADESDNDPFGIDAQLLRVSVIRGMRELMKREGLVAYFCEAIGPRGFQCDRPVLPDGKYDALPMTRQPSFYAMRQLESLFTSVILDGLSCVPRNGSPHFEIIKQHIFPKAAGYEVLLRRLSISAIRHRPQSDVESVDRGDAVSYVIEYDDQNGEPSTLEMLKVGDVDHRLIVPKSTNLDATMAKAKRRALVELYTLIAGSDYVSAGGADDGHGE